jgi:hypothetical protein
MIHAEHPTSSPGKSRQTEEIRLFLNKNNRTRNDGVAVRLVGCKEGLKRHIEQNEREGFSQEQMFVIERDEETYKGLLEEKLKKGFLCHIILGDFFEAIIDLCSEGFTIAHLDFDGCVPANYDNTAVKLFELVKTSRSYSFTWSCQGKSDEATERLGRELGMEKKCVKTRDGRLVTGRDTHKRKNGKTWVQEERPKHYRLKEMMERYAAKILPASDGWHHDEVGGYRGLTSMQWITGKKWDNLNAPFVDAVSEVTPHEMHKRFIPPFALKNDQLTTVLNHKTWLFVHSVKKPPSSWDYAAVNALATKKAIVAPCTLAPLVEYAGGYVEWLRLLTDMAWLKGQKSPEIAAQLGISKISVRQNLQRLRRIARELGFDVGRENHRLMKNHRSPKNGWN